MPQEADNKYVFCPRHSLTKTEQKPEQKLNSEGERKQRLYEYE